MSLAFALAAWSAGQPEPRKAADESWQPPYLAHLLIDPYAVVRFVAQRSLRSFEGYEDLGYDFQGDPTQAIHAREEAIRRWHVRGRRPGEAVRAEVLVAESGGLIGPEIIRLAAQRDDRPLVLEE